VGIITYVLREFYIEVHAVSCMFDYVGVRLIDVVDSDVGELERLSELLGALIQLYVQLISRQDTQHWFIEALRIIV
jgi:hypothetical protein